MFVVYVWDLVYCETIRYDNNKYRENEQIYTHIDAHTYIRIYDREKE